MFKHFTIEQSSCILSASFPHPYCMHSSRILVLPVSLSVIRHFIRLCPQRLLFSLSLFYFKIDLQAVSCLTSSLLKILLPKCLTIVLLHICAYMVSETILVFEQILQRILFSKFFIQLYDIFFISNLCFK